MPAGVGSLVRVRFNGRRTRGWILGPTSDVPGRMLRIDEVVSPVRCFDGPMLSLARWVSERYVSPLAAVLDRITPPRVVSEETSLAPASERPAGRRTLPAASVLPGYRGAGALLRSIGTPRLDGTFVLRPAPEDETTVCVEAVNACLASGRRAVVLVPEASPIPATARALEEAFRGRVAMFVGGDRRSRYRMWLDIAAGTYDVVVGTRPGVFAPVRELGLLFVSRESHPGHREERAPYYHVRDVALERARMHGATCVLSALCPSSEAATIEATDVSPAGRRWPPVQVVAPGPEGRAPRLVQALRTARRAFVYAPVPGSGVAQVCRTCGAPAACAACGGLLREQAGEIRCVVCESPGRCARCGGASFGVRPGGAERVEEWAGRAAASVVRRPTRPRLPRDGEILVGGPEHVRDLGPGGLDLVGILDADAAARRPGLAATERALATWMEAVGWARPNGRAIVQSSRSSDAAIQALVRGNPARFHEREAARRRDAGFPVGAAVFRVTGRGTLSPRVAALNPITQLVSAVEDRTVCLVALEPAGVVRFGDAMRELASEGVVDRVEAEPHL